MTESSVGIEKLCDLFKVDRVPMRRSSVLLSFNFRKFEVNQDLMSEKQSVRDEGGSLRLGLVDR